MEQREELEIETRLRAALTARSELVTHSTLRPGIPPNEHTAGLKTRNAGFWTSWRRFLVPATVAAALVGGVFVGAQLPDNGNKGGTSAASGTPGGPATTGALGAMGTASAGGTGTAPGNPADSQATQPSAQGAPAPAANAASVATVQFALADGWQITTIDATSACVAPKTKGNAPGGTTTGTGTATSTAAGNATPGTLPCGLDALYVKSDAAADAWPRSTASSATGWWPKAVDEPAQITCPSVKPDAANHVADSVSLRTSAGYPLAPGTPAGAAGAAGAQLAKYHEWAVTCDKGAGVRPMLWELLPAGSTAGTANPGKAAVVTVVSSDPAYDAALLGMVGTLHLAG